MTDGDVGSDSRLALAFQLLQSLVDPAGAAPGGTAQRAHMPALPPPEAERRLSATDLISWWFQPSATAYDPWDEYFSAAAPSGPGGGAAQAGPWTALQALIASPEEELADEQAEAAVQCLYEFIHAMGRRDVDGALELVADDYHTIEDDREIDRLGLRQQLESLLASLEGWQLETSLVTIPEPIPHATGVVIMAEIQVDAFRPEDDAWRSIIQRRVAVLEHQPGKDWLITALSPV